MDHMNMEQAQCIEFIETYRNFPILWNAKTKDYHNRNKREGAWKIVSATMGIPVPTLKSKMKNMMGTFRSEKSRENKKTTGSGSDSVYTSKWFAHKYFDFLSDKNTPMETLTSIRETIDLDSQEEPLQFTTQSTSSYSGETTTVDASAASTSNSGQHRTTSAKRSTKRKRGDEDQDSKLLGDPFVLLKSSVDVSTDSYNCYGQYSANELRKYNGPTLAMVKMAFSDVMFKADMGMLPYNNAQPMHFTPDAYTPYQISTPFTHLTAGETVSQLLSSATDESIEEDTTTKFLPL